MVHSITFLNSNLDDIHNIKLSIICLFCLFYYLSINIVIVFQVLQWKRTENATFKELRMRRPKIKAVIGISKQAPTFEPLCWAFDKLDIETTISQTTENCISHCIEKIPGISNSNLTPGTTLNATAHNNTTASNCVGKHQALCPSLVLLDLKPTKELDPETVSR